MFDVPTLIRRSVTKYLYACFSNSINYSPCVHVIGSGIQAIRAQINPTVSLLGIHAIHTLHGWRASTTETYFCSNQSRSILVPVDMSEEQGSQWQYSWDSGSKSGNISVGILSKSRGILNTLQLLWEILFRKWLDCRLTMIVRCCSLGQLTSNNLICSSPLHLGWPVELYVCVHSLYACESVNGAVLVHRYKKELQRLLIR